MMGPRTIIAAQQADVTLAMLCVEEEACSEGPKSHSGVYLGSYHFTFPLMRKSGVECHHLDVPHSYRHTLIQLSHSDLYGGSLGTGKFYVFYWPPK